MTRSEIIARYPNASSAFIAKNASDSEPVKFIESEAAEKESELHSEIAAECARRGWKAFHGSMIHVSRRTLSEPDFTIAADGGRTFFVEAKTKTGKLSVGQQAVKAHLARLGHTVHVIRSIEEFIEAVNKP